MSKNRGPTRDRVGIVVVVGRVCYCWGAVGCWGDAGIEDQKLVIIAADFREVLIKGTSI